MLVDVVRLRDRGTKLSADEVRGAVPMRGNLTFVTEVKFNQTRSAMASLQLVGANSRIELHAARITKVVGNDLLVAGTEYNAPAERIGSTQVCDQTWWCRVVVNQG